MKPFKKSLLLVMLFFIFVFDSFSLILSEIYSGYTVRDDIPFNGMYLKYYFEIRSALDVKSGEIYFAFRDVGRVDEIEVETRIILEGEVVDHYSMIISLQNRVILECSKYPSYVGKIWLTLTPVPLYIGKAFNLTGSNGEIIIYTVRGTSILNTVNGACECWIMESKEDRCWIEKTTGVLMAETITKYSDGYKYEITRQLSETNIQNFPPKPIFFTQLLQLSMYSFTLGIILLGICPVIIIFRKLKRKYRMILGGIILALTIMPILYFLSDYILIPINVSSSSIEAKIFYTTLTITGLILIGAILSSSLLSILTSILGSISMLYALMRDYTYLLNSYTLSSMVGMAVISSLIWFTINYGVIRIAEYTWRKITKKPTPAKIETEKIEVKGVREKVEEEYGEVKEEEIREYPKTTLMFTLCPHCGAKVKLDQKFCQNCGRKLEGIEEETECPFCKTKTTLGEKYCPSCGYEFETGKKGVGPFKFTYPEVESIYKPSGKVSLKGKSLILLTGILAGASFGAISSIILYILILASYIIGFTYLNIRGWKIALTSLMLFFGAPILAGMLLGRLISWTIDKVTLKVKNRSIKTARIVGYIAASIGFLCYLPFSLSVLTYSIKAEWWYIMLSIPLYIVGLRMQLKNIGKIVKEKPFCENCERYMEKIEVATIPIRCEEELMENLKSRTLDKIISLPTATKEDKDYSEVSMWRCNSCGQGIINVKTIQVRFKYKNEKIESIERRSQLIYSSYLNKEETDKIIKGIYAKKKIIIIYDPQSTHTEKIAETLTQGFKDYGSEVHCIKADEAEIEKITEYNLLVIGSPIERIGATKTIRNLLKELGKINLEGKEAFAFEVKVERKLIGSAGREIEEKLKKMGVKIVKHYETAIIERRGETLRENMEEKFRKIAHEIMEKTLK